MRLHPSRDDAATQHIQWTTCVSMLCALCAREARHQIATEREEAEIGGGIRSEDEEEEDRALIPKATLGKDREAEDVVP